MIRILGISLLLSLLIGGVTYPLGAATDRGRIPSRRDGMQRIVSIRAEESQAGTHIRVIGDGDIPQFTTKTLHSPNRIIIDLMCRSDSFETTIWPLRSDHCKEIRAGHHDQKIRVVLDTKGDGLPIYRITAKGNELLIVLGPSLDFPSPSPSPDAGPEDGEKSNPSPGNALQTDVFPHVSEDKGEEERARRKEALTEIGHESGWTEDRLLESLLNVDMGDTGKDTAAFTRAGHAFRIRNWKWAIEEFDQIIKNNPSGKYAEKACFLRAMAYDRIYANTLPEHIEKVAEAYKDAINRYPSSEYVNHAQLALGNLYQRAKKFYEALGYYNLIYKLDERSVPALRALIEKAKILHTNNRPNEALAILRNVIAAFPPYPEITEAKLELAKMLYERNKFHQSLKILLDLNRMDPPYRHRYPEILLYLGYNHYQLGAFQKARHYLMTFYNIRPDDEGNHLLLSQIGDSLREEGRLKDAAKFYQLVSRRYPDTEGAIISRIRLAEQLEKADIVTSIMIENREISSPRIVYEDIMKHYHDREEKSPLTELTLLKLALFHYKEENYKKSFYALKELLVSYPKTGLIKEAKHTLERTIKAIFKEAIALEKYSKVIKIYHNEEYLFSLLDSPELLIMIARAAIRLDLMDLGMEMFKKADPLIPPHEKPEDLLFYTGKCLFEAGDLHPALKQFDLLTARYPHSSYAPDAYLLKGDIFMRLKEFEKAAEIFSFALNDQMGTCQRLKLLITRAGALNRAKNGKEALQTLKEAHRMRGDCDQLNHRLYREMGNLYLHFGYAQAALDFFLELLSTEKDSSVKIPVKFKVAQCYSLLDKEEDSLALYDQIAGLNEPFWSDLAKEKMNQISFKKEIASMESQ